jgi:hypothetical protein
MGMTRIGFYRLPWMIQERTEGNQISRTEGKELSSQADDRSSRGTYLVAVVVVAV